MLLTELQSWLVVGFAGLAAVGTCVRAYVAWRTWKDWP